MQEVKSLRILVAEENPVTQRVLSNMLIYNGHNPLLFADTSESVLEGLSRDDVDLALINWGIVSAQDFALLKVIQDKGIYELLPLMVMVPGMDEDCVAKLSSYGIKHCIPLPIPAHLLPKKIEEAVYASPKARLPAKPDASEDHAGDGPKHGDVMDDVLGSTAIPASVAAEVAAIQKAYARKAAPPPDAKALYSKGREALMARRFDEAVGFFVQALDLKPLSPTVCKGLGLAYQGQGEQSKARHYFNKAAVSYVRTGKYEEAARLYRDLEKAGFKSMNPFKALANWHKANNQGTKALPLYEDAARLSPKDPVIAYNIFLLQRRMNNLKAALAAVINLLRACEDVTDRKNLAWADGLYQKITGRTWGAPAPETPDPDGTTTSQPTILIVDDEPQIRFLLKRALESLEDDGASILFAENGEQGLAMIKRLRPDLVFLDVMMPKMNGFDVCNEVKNKQKMVDVFVIMLTAKAQEFDRRKGLESGANVYMTKPFRPAELAKIARAVLDM